MKDPTVRRDGFGSAPWTSKENVQPSIRSFFLGRLLNSAKPVENDDGSDVGLISYPYSATFDGVPGRIPSYRLLSPFHTSGCQVAAGGIYIPPASEGEESHL